mgnify:CR=1 FL=1
MYVRMFWGKLKLGMWDEYEKLYTENIEPLTEGIKGFRGRQLLRSTENPDEGISLTIWDTLEDMEHYRLSPRRHQLARQNDQLYSGDYWEKHFEIRSETNL